MIYVYLGFACLFILVTYLLLTKTDLKRQKFSFKFAMALIIALIFITRIYRLNSLQGLDFDEAMGGINSWSLANYGVDFHLTHNPIYLYAWGSGMNVLYPLLTVPFIKIWGLSIITYRLPMALLGIISSLFLISALIYAKYPNRKIIVYSAIILLSPGTIIPSRWAVESNIFPILFTFILSFFIFFLYTQSPLKKVVWYWLIVVMLGTSAYAYSSNWLFLFIFIILFLCWSYRKHFISIPKMIVVIFTFALIDWPLVAFIYVNYVSHKQLTILGLTITKLAESRGNSQFIFQNGTSLPRAVLNNALNTFGVIVQGNDGLIKNAIPGIGLFYPLMITFALIGIIYFIKNYQGLLDQFMFIMLASNLLTVLFIIPNFTHLNALTIPVLYFESKGVMATFTSLQSMRIFSVVFLLLFSIFAYEYMYVYHVQLISEDHETPIELQQMIKQTNPEKHRIYFVTGDETYGGLYTIALFSRPVSPYIFKAETSNVGPAAFTSYTSFNNYYFEDNIPKKIKGVNPILIVKKDVDISNFMRTHKDYRVVKGQYYYYIKK